MVKLITQRMSIYSAFSLLNLGSAHRVFNLHVPRSCAYSIFTCFSFMYFLITSLPISCGLPSFRYPPIPCSHYNIFLCNVFLSTSPIHLSIASLIFSLMFTTHALVLISSFMIFKILFISIIHLNILISVLSWKFSSPFLAP